MRRHAWRGGPHGSELRSNWDLKGRDAPGRGSPRLDPDRHKSATLGLRSPNERWGDSRIRRLSTQSSLKHGQRDQHALRHKPVWSVDPRSHTRVIPSAMHSIQAAQVTSRSPQRAQVGVPFPACPPRSDPPSAPRTRTAPVVRRLPVHTGAHPVQAECVRRVSGHTWVPATHYAVGLIGKRRRVAAELRSRLEPPECPHA